MSSSSTRARTSPIISDSSSPVPLRPVPESEQRSLVSRRIRQFKTERTAARAAAASERPQKSNSLTSSLFVLVQRLVSDLFGGRSATADNAGSTGSRRRGSADQSNETSATGMSISGPSNPRPIGRTMNSQPGIDSGLQTPAGEDGIELQGNAGSEMPLAGASRRMIRFGDEDVGRVSTAAEVSVGAPS